MPDTPIDLSEGIQSVRLKVPTAPVPIPPGGFGQLHSPAPGELAIRLPDGSVVAVGGGGGGGGAATSVLGPGGAIDAANSDPRIGININAAPGTGIGFTGRFLDQFARPLGVQIDTVPVSSAELLALHTIPKVLAAGVAGHFLVPLVVIGQTAPGSTPYTVPADTLQTSHLSPGGAPGPDVCPGLDFVLDDLSPQSTVRHCSGFAFTTANILGRPLVLSAELGALTDGDGSVAVSVAYLVV